MKPTEIRSLRRRNGWTQAALAGRLGTDAVTVSRWERGASRPRPSARARLRELSGPAADLSADAQMIGYEEAGRVLQRARLLLRRPKHHGFSMDPASRLREVDRALREQTRMKAGARVKS